MLDRVPVKATKHTCAVCGKPGHSRRHVLDYFRGRERLRPWYPDVDPDDKLDEIARAINDAQSLDDPALQVAARVLNAALANDPQRIPPATDQVVLATRPRLELVPH